MAKSRPKIEELRRECQVRGLPMKGTQKELQQRLTDYEAGLFKSSNASLESFDRLEIPQAHYLLQLQRENLAMYFASGVIYPANLEPSAVYRDENRKQDILSMFPDYLVLSKGIVDRIDDSEVLVEMVLAADEASNLQHRGFFFFLNEPLPISRIVKIYFLNDQSRTSFLSSMKIFPDSFVPSDICDIVPAGIATYTSPAATDLIRSEGDWRHKMDYFDRLMGMVAFLKNTSLFYADKTNEYQEYTNVYFDVLPLINGYFGEPVKSVVMFRWIINPDIIDVDRKIARFQFRAILYGIYQNTEFNIDWAINLLDASIKFDGDSLDSRAELQSIRNLFVDYKAHKIDYKAILVRQDVRKSIPLTIMVFLVKFSNKSLGHSDKQAVKNYFRSEECTIDRNTAEYIFAVLGLYYGYRNLVKSDEIKLKDLLFNEIVKNESNIKFRLDSYLDRLTIESIFKFVVGGFVQINDAFDMLKSNRAAHLRKIQIPIARDVEYLNQSFFKVDKMIVKIRKIDGNQLLIQRIDARYDTNITQQSYLFTFVARHYPHLLSINKQEFLDLLSKNSKDNFFELRDAIELDVNFVKSSQKR